MDNTIILNRTETVGFAYFIREFYREDINILLVFENSKKVEVFSKDLESLRFPLLKNVLYFPYSIEDDLYIYLKTSALTRLISGDKGLIFVTDFQELKESVISLEKLEESKISLKKNAKLPRDLLLEFFERFNYSRVDRVERRGEYSVRGGIIDFFPHGERYPLRLEFWGDIVESIRIFSEDTQTTIERIREREVFLSNYKSSEDLLLEDFLKNFGKFKSIIIDGEDNSFSITHAPVFYFLPSFLEKNSPVFSIDIPPSFIGKISLFMEEIKRYIRKGYSIYIYLSTEGLIERFREIFDEAGLFFAETDSFIDKAENIVYLIKGELSSGFLIKDKNLVVFTEREILGRKRNHKRASFRGFSKKKKLLLSDFREGDYVVHKDYGIGIYKGLVTMKGEEGEKEYIAIEYKDKDILYLSPQRLYLLKKYIGATPALNKLKGGEWKRLKERVRKEAQEVAKRLYELYTERNKKKGFAFHKDTIWQRELELSFPYNETEDQLKALEDVKRDMERDVPMERIICGDVGYGKTEIAVRAAFKAVESGKQVAFLVPTTILASQHYETFRERLSPFPVEIDVLSRFRAQKEQKNILKRLAQGDIDIIIGTHRLLQKDVKFKDLGLLIIDEEQRFGVMHKERLKELKKDIDVLVLTATPIPRTLYMALTGVRDLSLITTPPESRVPIKTFVYKKNNKIIKEAILNEMKRGGQVFYVHNRIKDLPGIKANLEAIIPGIRVTIAHGQMDSDLLEDILIDFWEGKYDVLLTTTIIEIGIDFPNVNTIIIDDSYRYGLSQLYQLRGRVGRSHRRAYAYLLYPSYDKLKGNSKKRLEAIFEYQELGSGFNLALRDLEIRGAGSILGKSQHGYNDVGMDLYSEFIREEISQIRENGIQNTNKEFDIGFDFYIPSSYISSPQERIFYYNRFSNVKEKNELKKIRDELLDRFGRFTKDIKRIFDIVSLKLDAEKVGFDKILKRGDSLVFVKDRKEYSIGIAGRSSNEILDLVRKIIQKELQNGKRD